MSLSLIIGAGVLSLLCLYFAFNVDETHFLLKFLFIFFALIFMFTLAVGVVQDTTQECSIETTSQLVNGSQTNFTQERVCFDTDQSSSVSLITLTGALFLLFAIYITIYILREVFDSRNFEQGKQ